MKRILHWMGKGALCAALAVGCATASSHGGQTVEATNCNAQALQNPPPEVARGNAPLQRIGPGVRNPRPEVFWGIARDDGHAGRVVNPSDPEIARGNRSADCSTAPARAGG
jgi:hypothetical protein